MVVVRLRWFEKHIKRVGEQSSLWHALRCDSRTLTSVSARGLLRPERFGARVAGLDPESGVDKGESPPSEQTGQLKGGYDGDNDISDSGTTSNTEE